MKNRGNKYEFDRKSFSFKEAGTHIGAFLLNVLKIFLVSVSLTVAIYALLTLFVNTDLDRKLRRENKMYEKIYPTLKPRQDLLENVIKGLEIKDNEIYGNIFHTAAPSTDPFNSLGFLFGSDTIPPERIVSYTTEKCKTLESSAKTIEDNFLEIFLVLASAENPMPPMDLPIRDITFPQIGASVGTKFSPFLKADVYHTGLDFIAALEEPVYSSADGVVIYVNNSRKGDGNVIEIEHKGGYVTRYEHLGMVQVKKGRSVKRGEQIGTVGLSGNSFAPHLHYEIFKDGVNVDPINYLFASVSSQEYSNMLYMSVNTAQSMD